VTAPASLIDQVRQEIARAESEGKPTPGRPKLAETLGVTQHQVRKALEELAREQTPGDTSSKRETSLRLVPTPAAQAASEAEPAPEPPAEAAAEEPAGAQVVNEPAPAPTDSEPDVASVEQAQEDQFDETPEPTTASEPQSRPAPAGGSLVAWAGFIFGSLVSVAANVLASRIPPPGAGPDWHPSVYAEVGAAVWPLALLLSVEVLSRIRWPKGAGWNLARFGGAGTVAVGSAVISYAHIAAVLGSWGYSALGAHVGPLVIDGLMTISGFALLATAGAHSGAKRRRLATTAG
jgi:hypothetical protein